MAQPTASSRLSFLNPWNYVPSAKGVASFVTNALNRLAYHPPVIFPQEKIAEWNLQVLPSPLKEAYDSIVLLGEKIFNNETLAVEEQSQVILSLYKLMESAHLFNFLPGEIRCINTIIEKLSNDSLYEDKDRHTVTALVRNIIHDKSTTWLEKNAKLENRIEAVWAERSVPPVVKTEKPQNMQAAIDLQVKRLKSNIVRMLVGGQVLPADKHNDLLEIMQDVSEEVLNPDTLFRDKIFAKIDQSDSNFLAKFWAKLSFDLFSPILTFYVYTLCDNLLKDLKSFIEKDPNQRLGDSIQVSVKPLHNFFNKILTELRDISQLRVLEVAPLTELGNRIENSSIGNLNQKQFLHKLLQVFLKYAPKLHWTTSASDHFYKRAQESFFVAKFWFYSWYVLFKVIGQVIAPLEWSVNKTIHKILETILAGAFPSLYSSTIKAVGVGTNYFHSMNKFILRKLTEIEDQMRNPKYTSIKNERDPSTSQVAEKQFVDLINSLLITCKITDKAGNIEDLRSFYTNNGILNNFIDNLKKSLTPDIGKNLFSLFDAFFEKNSLEEFLLFSLENLNTTCFNPQSSASSITSATMQVTEANRSRQLRETVKLGVQQALDYIFDPTPVIQVTADGFIVGIRNDIKKFIENFKAIEDQESLKPQELYTDILQSIKSRATQAGSALKEPTDEIRKTFLEQTKEIDRRIKKLYALGEEINKNSQKQKALNDLKKHLEDFQTGRKKLDDLMSSLRELPTHLLPEDTRKHFSGLHQFLGEKRLEQQRNGYIAEYVKHLKIKIEEIRLSKDQVQKEISTEFFELKNNLLPTLNHWAEKLPPLTYINKESSLIKGARYLGGKIANACVPDFVGKEVNSITDGLLNLLNDEKTFSGLLRSIGTAYIQHVER